MCAVCSPIYLNIDFLFTRIVYYLSVIKQRVMKIYERYEVLNTYLKVIYMYDKYEKRICQTTLTSETQ